MKLQPTVLAAALLVLPGVGIAGEKPKTHPMPAPQSQSQRPTSTPTTDTSKRPVEDPYVHGRTVHETAQQQGDFMQFDNDKNGTLTRAELSGNADLTSRFATLDKDGNGQLTRDEFGQGVEAKDVAPLKGTFTQLDDDHSGSLTQAEAADDATLHARFAELDADNNGKLTQVEYNDSVYDD